MARRAVVQDRNLCTDTNVQIVLELQMSYVRVNPNKPDYKEAATCILLSSTINRLLSLQHLALRAINCAINEETLSMKRT